MIWKAPRSRPPLQSPRPSVAKRWLSSAPRNRLVYAEGWQRNIIKMTATGHLREGRWAESWRPDETDHLRCKKKKKRTSLQGLSDQRMEAESSAKLPQTLIFPLKSPRNNTCRNSTDPNPDSFKWCAELNLPTYMGCHGRSLRALPLPTSLMGLQLATRMCVPGAFLPLTWDSWDGVQQQLRGNRWTGRTEGQK